MQETIAADTSADLITLEFQRSDGTLITQIIDFRKVSIAQEGGWGRQSEHTWRMRCGGEKVEVCDVVFVVVTQRPLALWLSPDTLTFTHIYSLANV